MNGGHNICPIARLCYLPPLNLGYKTYVGPILIGMVLNESTLVNKTKAKDGQY